MFVSVFLGLIVSTIIALSISIMLLPLLIVAIFFEWGFSRWERARFNKHRYFTILILCIAVRLLLSTTCFDTPQRLGTQFRQVVDTISDYRTY